MMTEKINVGIVGGAGYTGGELLRLLINHPHVDLRFVYSGSQHGKPVWETHRDLFGQTDLVFTNKLNPDVDVLFLCMGHGASSKFIAENDISPQIKIIDLSQDFRLKASENQVKQGEFVYGLPEINKEKIQKAQNIANPGCFATAIQLALLPLANSQLLPEHLHVSGVTGSTGAGQNPTPTGHFSWRNNNVSAYKVFTHQHLLEINEQLLERQPEYAGLSHFIPQRGNFTRGIMVFTSFESDLPIEEFQSVFQSFYKNEVFTKVCPFPLDLKLVVNTNSCFLHIQKEGKNVLITSAIDNLLKGASGQAVQNMNLMFNLPENTGLQLKAIGF